MRSSLSIASLALVTACAEPPPPPPPGLPPPAEGEGIQLAMSTTIPAFAEGWACVVYDLPRSEDLFFHVNRVHSQQTVGTHHMTISTLAFSNDHIEPGTYDCDRLYADHPNLMGEMVQVYGSQDPDATLQLPEGVVASLPAEVRMLHEIHYVNTTEQPVTAWATVNAYTIPKDEVTGHIWGFVVNDRNIALPARKQSVEWTRCAMSEDVDMLFLSTHTHKLGERATITRVDDGEVLYENTDWHFPPLLALDPPLHVAAGTVMELRCAFDNRGDADVAYGFAADDEMCEMIFVFMNGSQSAECTPIEASDGILEQ